MIGRIGKPAITVGLAASILASSCTASPEIEPTPETNLIIDLTADEVSVIVSPPETAQNRQEQKPYVALNEFDNASGGTPDPFPSPESFVTRVVVESQDPEIGVILDNKKIVFGKDVENPGNDELGVLNPNEDYSVTTVSSEVKMLGIVGHSSADRRTGKKAATYGVINSELFPYGAMPEDPGVNIGDVISVYTSDGFMCKYSIIDLREILKQPEFEYFSGDLNVDKPYLDEGVYPLEVSPGVYANKTYREIGPDYGTRSLVTFLIEATKSLDRPLIYINGSYAGLNGSDFVWSDETGNNQSAWVFAVGGVLDGCVQIEEVFQTN